MIRAQGLTKTFGQVRAVDGFSFEVQPGEIYGLLGPNGAGKTTTTRLLSCLLRPSAGTACVAGHSIERGAHLIRRQIGILTEVPGLYTRLTPSEYLDFFARVHDIPAARRRARIDEVLQLVGMGGHLQRSVMRGFSKGMQQRVAIARALLHDPEVLFFDEPTAALDPEAAKRIRDHLRDLARHRGRTVLLCTHNLPEAEQLCHRLSIVRHGQQIAEGTPVELRHALRGPVSFRVRVATRELMSRLSAVDGVSGLTVEAGDGVIRYRTTTPEKTNPEVVRAAVAAGADVLGLREEEASLEDAYLALMRGDPACA